MMTLENLIEGCREKDKKCQEKLYRSFSSKMYGICLRFAKNEVEAEDILQEGFIKVFTNLHTFRNECHIEGWIRRIMINTAINFYKKKLPSLLDLDFDRLETPCVTYSSAIDNLSTAELQRYISDLPKGYRMVFNLNAIQGYSHKEISEMLKISVNTSKSQLARARKSLQRKIEKQAEPILPMREIMEYDLALAV
ncbi:MAG: sigma-70 family RNA polymerase sigma factor [Bacteroidales bacterium]|nr:sigma-70 family RNA polymerase sigma factor [Bacteroidales bacterium]